MSDAGDSPLSGHRSYIVQSAIKISCIFLGLSCPVPIIKALTSTQVWLRCRCL